MIEPEKIESACHKANLTIEKRNTVLLYTDHHRKFFGTENWNKGPGVQQPPPGGWEKKDFQLLVWKPCRREFRKFQIGLFIKSAGN
ncbi:MAG: hypothetical protein WD398_12125 [Cyclobacteriaceae bacterium]